MERERRARGIYWLVAIPVIGALVVFGSLSRGSDDDEQSDVACGMFLDLVDRQQAGEVIGDQALAAEMRQIAGVAVEGDDDQVAEAITTAARAIDDGTLETYHLEDISSACR